MQNVTLQAAAGMDFVLRKQTGGRCREETTAACDSMAPLVRFERTTVGLEVRRSIH
jgi:hypothetical protein